MKYSYKVDGVEVELKVDPTLVAVEFNEHAPKSMRSQAVDQISVGVFKHRIDVPSENISLISTVNHSFGKMAASDAIDVLSVQESVEQSFPVFKVAGNSVIAPNRILVGFTKGNEQELRKLLNERNITVLEENESYLVCEAPKNMSIFELCRELDKLTIVKYVEPDFVTVGRHIAKDSFQKNGVQHLASLDKQYALKLTESIEAWNIQTGDPNVVVAILDEGIDTAHKDLSPIIVGTFDATDGDSYQEPNSWDGHGTACAGLAVGAASSGGGMRGVGIGCSLLAVRIAYSPVNGVAWMTNSNLIAKGLNWSWQSGAAVLNNSWGGGLASNAINDAIESAKTKGRNGKGCVVVVSAGNSSADVLYPGNVSGVLTVSASNQYDEVKTYYSSDGETDWGTCFGPEVDVAAPGVQNFTCDISGVGGYNNGDYYHFFNGTSSSAPLVAGACALIISARPDLSESAVRKVIRQSADKVGGHPYVRGRNDYFGYGRLNVAKAIDIALALPQS